MRWPSFWSSSSSLSDEDLEPKRITNEVQPPRGVADEVLSNANPPKKVPSVIPHSTDWSSLLAVTPTQLLTARENILPTIILTSTCLAFYAFYRSYLRRIPAAGNISPEFFRTRSLVGRVTSVGDGDNFRIFHTPGGRLAGWGWMPWRRVPTERKALKDKTIHIRLAGVDAPELPHFGRPAQPYSQEALRWLTDYVLNRRVRAYIYKRDQYDRVVATVYVRKGLLQRDVGLQMLKAGLATVYEAKTGSEFGVGLEEKYRKAEWWARWRKKGMWAGKSEDFESPREYKTRHASETPLEQIKGK